MDDPEREQVARRERAGDGGGARQLGLGLGEVALLHPQVAEVVARHRLLPRLAGLDRERQQLLQALGPVRDAHVAEHDAAHPAGEHAQQQVARAVGQLDGELGLGQRGGVGAREEVEVALQRGQLGAREGVLARVQVALGGQRQRAVEVAEVQRDDALQRQRAGPQRVLAAGAGARVDVDRDRERARGVLPVGAAGVVELVREGGHGLRPPSSLRAPDLSR